MPPPNNPRTNEVIDAIVPWLFREKKLTMSLLAWLKLLACTLLITPRAFSQAFFDALAQKIISSENDSTLSPEQKKLALHAALSYLPFADPQENATLYINGIEYRVRRIPLTSGWLSAPYYLYLLEPQQDGPSYALFSGTTFPAGGGFLAGLFADTAPYFSIGQFFFERAHPVISDTIIKAYLRYGQHVTCIGSSLGGSLSLLCHAKYPNLTNCVAFNPASLNFMPADKPSGGRLTRGKCNVVIHRHDPVFALGHQILPAGAEVFMHGEPEGSLGAHARAPAAGEVPNWQAYCREGQKKNILWTLIKPFLFFSVLVLHTLAFVPRVLFKTAQTIAHFHHHTNQLTRNFIYLSLLFITLAIGVGLLSLPSFGILPLIPALAIALSMLIPAVSALCYLVAKKIQQIQKPLPLEACITLPQEQITLEADKICLTHLNTRTGTDLHLKVVRRPWKFFKSTVPVGVIANVPESNSDTTPLLRERTVYAVDKAQAVHVANKLLAEQHKASGRTSEWWLTQNSSRAEISTSLKEAWDHAIRP